MGVIFESGEPFPRTAKQKEEIGRIYDKVAAVINAEKGDVDLAVVIDVLYCLIWEIAFTTGNLMTLASNMYDIGDQAREVGTRLGHLPPGGPEQTTENKT